MKRIKKFWSGLKLNIKFTIIIIAFAIVPIIVFSMSLFQNMEDNIIREKKNAMEYNMAQSYSQILKQVDSINMSTQFFLRDQALSDFLRRIKANDSISIEELRYFYNVNVASLERMVNNNPYLYQIRVYVKSDTMQEMIPLLYRKERMERLSWARDDELFGWKFHYIDTLFSSFVMNQNKEILSLVTPITDYEHGELAVLEVAVSMESMFPYIYQDMENKWNCFLDMNGNEYYREEKSGENPYLGQILQDAQTRGNTAGVYNASIHGKNLMIGYMPVKELSGTLVYVNSMEDEIGVIHRQRNLYIIYMLFIVAFLIVLINWVVKALLRQFYEILRSIREVQKGDLDVVIENCGADEMGELGNQINTMLVRIKRLMADNINRELLVKNSEIRALQNQINAHFIYNVLESIKMMAEIKEEYAISDAITTLGKLLRYGMKWVSGNVTVEEEIDYIKNYLALINLRFDYEIYLSLNIPDIIYKQEIPKMSLQPIVENAIYHGIEQLAEDTNIYVKGLLEGDDCMIEITDAGKGMTEEELSKLYRKISGEIETFGGSGNGIGLKNVQDRIKISFGENYGIEIATKLGCYTKVCVRIPLKKEGNHVYSIDR